MPRWKTIGPYRFFIWAGEPVLEPPHCHVERKGGGSAKFWLNPVSVAKNRGFKAKELSKITGYVMLHREEFEEKYKDYVKPVSR